LASGYILFSQHKSQLNLQFLTALMDIEGRLQFAASDVSPPPYIEQHFLDWADVVVGVDACTFRTDQEWNQTFISESREQVLLRRSWTLRQHSRVSCVCTWVVGRLLQKVIYFAASPKCSHFWHVYPFTA